MNNRDPAILAKINTFHDVDLRELLDADNLVSAATESKAIDEINYAVTQININTDTSEAFYLALDKLNVTITLAIKEKIYNTLYKQRRLDVINKKLSLVTHPILKKILDQRRLISVDTHKDVLTELDRLASQVKLDNTVKIRFIELLDMLIVPLPAVEIAEIYNDLLYQNEFEELQKPDGVFYTKKRTAAPNLDALAGIMYTRSDDPKPCLLRNKIIALDVRVDVTDKRSELVKQINAILVVDNKAEIKKLLEQHWDRSVFKSSDDFEAKINIIYGNYYNTALKKLGESLTNTFEVRKSNRPYENLNLDPDEKTNEGKIYEKNLKHYLLEFPEVRVFIKGKLLEKQPDLLVEVEALAAHPEVPGNKEKLDQHLRVFFASCVAKYPDIVLNIKDKFKTAVKNRREIDDKIHSKIESSKKSLMNGKEYVVETAASRTTAENEKTLMQVKKQFLQLQQAALERDTIKLTIMHQRLTDVTGGFYSGCLRTLNTTPKLSLELTEVLNHYIEQLSPLFEHPDFVKIDPLLLEIPDIQYQKLKDFLESLVTMDSSEEIKAALLAKGCSSSFELNNFAKSLYQVKTKTWDDKKPAADERMYNAYGAFMKFIERSADFFAKDKVVKESVSSLSRMHPFFKANVMRPDIVPRIDAIKAKLTANQIQLPSRVKRSAPISKEQFNKDFSVADLDQSQNNLWSEKGGLVNALAKDEYAIHNDEELNARFYEHTTVEASKEVIRIKAMVMPSNLTQVHLGVTYPSDELLKFAEDQLATLRARTSQPIKIQPDAQNPLLVKAYLLVAKAKCLQDVVNDSGLTDETGMKYEPKQDEIDFVRTHEFKPEKTVVDAQADLVTMLIKDGLTDEAQKIQDCITDHVVVTAQEIDTILQASHPLPKNGVF